MQKSTEIESSSHTFTDLSKDDQRVFQFHRIGSLERFEDLIGQPGLSSDAEITNGEAQLEAHQQSLIRALKANGLAAKYLRDSYNLAQERDHLPKSKSMAI